MVKIWLQHVAHITEDNKTVVCDGNLRVGELWHNGNESHLSVGEDHMLDFLFSQEK